MDHGEDRRTPRPDHRDAVPVWPAEPTTHACLGDPGYLALVLAVPDPTDQGRTN